MNALADSRVADYLNDHFVCTYLKVGTFQIVAGQKVGGNVASYFCLSDGAVVHAVPGQTNADTLLSEARWAYEVRKSALTMGTNLVTGIVDMKKYQHVIAKSHEERFAGEGTAWGNKYGRPGYSLPTTLPRGHSAQAQANWLLARNPLAKLDTIYPVVWTQILREQLSALPVAKR